MPDSFNPYHEWLGLDVACPAPDYYQLLGIERDAPAERIKRAADYAINRVRSVRPGSRAAAWSKLIDELRTAQSVLTDEAKRRAYDARLGEPSASASSPGPAAKRDGEATSVRAPRAPSQPDLVANEAADDDFSYAFPPTYYAAQHPPATPAGGLPAGAAPLGGYPFTGQASDASAPQSPAPWTYSAAAHALPYVDPMAPVTGPEMPGASGMPMAPGGYYGSLPYAPTTPQLGPGGIPYARPVATGPLAVAATPVSLTAAAPAAPLGTVAQPVVPIPAPVGKVRRRRSKLWHNLAVGAVAVAMVAAVAVGLQMALDRGGSAPQESSVAVQANAAAGNRGMASSPAVRSPQHSSVPAANANLPPLTLPGAPSARATPEPRDDAPAPVDPAMPATSAAASDPPPATETPPAADPPREPTEEEKSQTLQAFQAAWAALREQNFEAADSLLAQVATLPKTPEDAKKYAGLVQLAQNARAFADAIRDGFLRLKPDQTIAINSTTVKVLEATPTSLSIEVAPGTVRKFTPDNLSLGLKYGIVNAVLDPNDSANALAKAAYHATHPNGDLAEARHFLAEAQGLGADVEGALLVVNGATPATTAAIAIASGTPATDTGATAEPAPAMAPTAKELQDLTRLAQTARAALAERNLEEAEEALAKAETLAKLPEHQEKIAHLKQLAHYTREFWRAVEEGLKGLAAGEEIKIADTIIVVVEASPNHVLIRAAGQNRRYTRRDMPGGLAMAIANLWLNESDAATRVVKGALYAVEKKGDPAKARQLWQEAGTMGLDVAGLLATLDESYDFAK